MYAPGLRAAMHSPILAFCLTLWLTAFMARAAGSEEASFNATIHLDPGRLRSIQTGSFKKSALDRSIYFRTYFPLGHEPDHMTELLKASGASTGRGTIWIPGLKEDPQRPGHVDPDSVKANMGKFYRWYKKAHTQWSGVSHAMALSTALPWLEGFGSEGKHQNREAYKAQAELVKLWYDHLKQRELSIPEWFTIWNEPHWSFCGRELGKYAEEIVNALSDSHPEVKVAGPCPAWPFPQNDNWRRWQTHEKAFIDAAGDRVAGYDFHFYSKGFWAYEGENIADSPSLYESQREFAGTVWDHGRVDSFLDLVAAHHMEKWNQNPLPVIVSEFGRQGIQHQFGPWENEFKPWLFMITVTNLWMRFMERPEVKLTVPFILHDASNTPRGMAIKNKDGMTRFRDFYAFFSDLAGERLPATVAGRSNTESRNILANAFLDDNIIYLLIHNRKGFPGGGSAVISVAFHNSGNNGPEKIEWADAAIKRLRWEGEVPEPHDDPAPDGKLRIDSEYESLEGLKNILIQGEETCIIRLELSETPKINKRIHEKNRFGRQTNIDIEAGFEHKLLVDRGENTAKPHKARIALGLYHDKGFSSNPIVRVNGQQLGDFDITYSHGITEYQAVEEIDLPPEILKEGYNTISVKFSSGISESEIAKILTARLIEIHEISNP